MYRPISWRSYPTKVNEMQNNLVIPEREHNQLGASWESWSWHLHIAQVRPIWPPFLQKSHRSSSKPISRWRGVYNNRWSKQLERKSKAMFVSYCHPRRKIYSFESRSISVASSKSMGTEKSNNFLIIESHTIENITNMSCSLGSVRKATIGSASRHIFIRSTWSPGNLRTTHFLQGTHSSKSPEIRIGNPRELLFYRFKMIAGNFQTSIGAMVGFRSKTLDVSAAFRKMESTMVAPLLPPVPVSLS